MRTFIRICIVALSMVATGHGQSTQSARNTVYISPNAARTVTISRSGATLTTLAVPRGTTISVTYDVAGSVLPINDGRFLFHGNVEVRAMVASQKDPTVRLEQAMLRSPLELTATGVDVEITP